MVPTGVFIQHIPEQSGQGFICNNEKYFAVKKEGHVYVYRNACPHIGIALEWVENQFLDSSHTMIQCANHGALFVIENGQCVSGPCTGKKLIPATFNIVNDEIVLR